MTTTELNPPVLIATHRIERASSLQPLLEAIEILGLQAEVEHHGDPYSEDDESEAITPPADEADTAWPWTLRVFAFSIPVQRNY